VRSRVLRPLLLVALLAGSVAAQPIGGEFRVNTTTAGGQRFGDVVVISSGRLVVVWSGADGSEYGVFGQRYNASGTTLGVEFRVNAVTTGNQSFPAIASDAIGQFVVVWQGYDLGLATPDVMAQRYSSAGTALGAPFRVNTYTTGAQTRPAIASDPIGNVTIVWEDASDGAGKGVFARRFDRLGGAIGDEFRVNTLTTGDQTFPAVSMDATGGFVVAWQDVSDGSGKSVFATRFLSTGGSSGHFRVNASTTGDQVRPGLALDASGAFLVTWTSLEEPRSIQARRFTSVGDPIGNEFRVNTSPSSSLDYSNAAASPGGTFIVAWDNGADVLAQRLTSTGALLGGEFRVNTSTTGNQQTPRVAASQAAFAVVWRSGPEPASEDVFGQRYTLVPVTGDANGDGVLDILDVFLLINFVFAGGPVPRSVSW
jgi:hypothetical protein